MIVDHKRGTLRAAGMVIETNFQWPYDFGIEVPGDVGAGVLKDKLNKALWKAPLISFSGCWVKQFRVDASVRISRCSIGWLWGIQTNEQFYSTNDAFRDHASAFYDFELRFFKKHLEHGANWWLYVNEDKASLVELIKGKYKVDGDEIIGHLNLAKIIAIERVGLEPRFENISVGKYTLTFS